MTLLTCAGDRKNIGVSSCKKRPTQIRGFFSTPSNFTITAQEAATSTAWQTAMLAAMASRIYLWPFAFAAENDNEDTVYENTSLGTINVRDGRYRWRMSMVENLELHKNMFTHKDFAGRIILIDDRNQLVLTSDDGGTTLKGFDIDLLNPEKLFFNDGTAGTKSPVYISLKDNLQLDLNGFIVDAASFINSLVRLTGVTLSIEGTPTASEIIVKVVSELDQTPILGLVSADFVLLDGAGDPQTISSSTDNEDGTYTLAGTTLVSGTLNLVAASALSVPGFESNGAVAVTI